MDDSTLSDYLAILRRRRRVVIACLVAALAIALAISLLQTRRYRAESQLLLRQTPTEALLIDDVGQNASSARAERELNNELRQMESRTVRDAVDEAYDGPLDVRAVRAAAANAESNDVIKLSVESTNPGAAADLVNLYADTYITVRRETRIDELLETGQAIQTRLDDLRARIAEVGKPLDDINAQVAAAPIDSEERALLDQQRLGVIAEVLPQLAPLQSRASQLQGQLAQLEITEDLARGGGLEVLDPAVEPRSPSSPDVVANVVVGGLIGLLGGIALAFLVERLDDSVRSKEMAEKLTGLATLGVIPRRSGGSSSSELTVLDEPASPAAEAYRLLRTSVRFLGLDGSMRRLLVTSAAPSEGKTVVAANLAIALAQGGSRVLLVGADLRRPRVHELFGAAKAPGLTSVLLEEVTVEAATYAIEEVPGLHVMAPGSAPPNPAELVDSARFRDLLGSLSEVYDMVVVDSPPVLPVTDAQVLTRSADGVLLVVAYGETSKRGLARAVELLGQVEAPLVGTVLNLVPTKEGYGGQTYRYDTYRSRSERRRARDERGSGTSLTTASPAHLPGNGAEPAPASGEPAEDAGKAT
jgi:tyrosine-protein kinase